MGHLSRLATKTTKRVIMKICLLGDTHFGVRSDSKEFSEFYRKFYTDTFFPYLKEHNITQVYQLGDLFDRRKYVNFYTLSECRDYFFDAAVDAGIHLHILIGNHDIFWRESLSINSPNLLLRDYTNITIYDAPTKVDVGGKLVDIIPWICAENEASVSEFITQSSADYCFGHFEIAGFQMYKGIDCHSGLSGDVFKSYDLVVSGHYHHRSRKGNIVYAGTPAEHTWADFDDPRGFHVLDTETGILEFIENPYTMFAVFYYDDVASNPLLEDMSQFAAKHIKLVVVNKKDLYNFDRFIERVYDQNPIELKIVEDMAEFEVSGSVDDNLNIEDTLTLLSQYCDGVVANVDNEKLKTLMKTLYIEAQHVEE